MANKPKAAKQAPMTAWKLMLDWLDVQLSLIEMGQAEVMQVFLPYAKCGAKSFFQVLKDDGYRALPGLPAPKAKRDDADDAEFTEGH